MYSKLVYPAGAGFEYDITNGNGERIIHQDFHPDLAGFEVMDEATANACADAVIVRLNAQDATQAVG